MMMITRYRFIVAAMLALFLVSCSQASPTVEQPAATEAVEEPYPYPEPQTEIFFTSPYPPPEGFENAETVDWETASQMISGGEVASIVQSPGYQEVYLTLKDGRYIQTMQPIGGVDSLLASCGDPCADIVVTNQ